MATAARLQQCQMPFRPARANNWKISNFSTVVKFAESQGPLGEEWELGEERAMGTGAGTAAETSKQSPSRSRSRNRNRNRSPSSGWKTLPVQFIDDCRATPFWPWHRRRLPLMAIPSSSSRSRSRSRSRCGECLSFCRVVPHGTLLFRHRSAAQEVQLHKLWPNPRESSACCLVLLVSSANAECHSNQITEIGQHKMNSVSTSWVHE